MKRIFLIIILTIGNFAYSQILFSDTKDKKSSNDKALIELYSTERGVLFPRLTSEQRKNMFKGITSDSVYISMLVYDNDLQEFMYWNGTEWRLLNFIENPENLFKNKVSKTVMDDSISKIRRIRYENLWVSKKTKLGYKKNDSTIIYNLLRIRNSTTFDTNINLSGNLIKNVGDAINDTDAVNLKTLNLNLNLKKTETGQVSLKMFNDTLSSLRSFINGKITKKIISDTAKKLRRGIFDSLSVSGKIRLGTSKKDSTIIYNRLKIKGTAIFKDKVSIGYLDPLSTLQVYGNSLITGDLDVTGTITNSSISSSRNDAKKMYLSNNSINDNMSDGGGFIMNGTTNKSILWKMLTKSWDFSENIDIPLGKEYMIDNKSINKSKVLTNVAYLDTKNEFSQAIVVRDTLFMNGKKIVQVGRAKNLTDIISLEVLNDSLAKFRKLGPKNVTLQMLSDTAKNIRNTISSLASDSAKQLKKQKLDSLIVSNKIRLGTDAKDTTIVYNTFKSVGKSIFYGNLGIGIENPNQLFHLKGDGKIEGNLNVLKLIINDKNIFLGNTTNEIDIAGINFSKDFIRWEKGNNSWNFSENIKLPKGKEFLINNQSINKSRVLTNVAYLDTTNTFSKSISINDTLSMNNNRITKLARAKDSLDAVNLVVMRDSINNIINRMKKEDKVTILEFQDTIKSLKKGNFDSIKVKIKSKILRLEIDSTQNDVSSVLNLRSGNKFGLYNDGDLIYKGDSLFFMNKGKKYNLSESKLNLTENTKFYNGIIAEGEVESNVSGEIGIPLYLNKSTGKYDVASYTNIDSANVIAITIDNNVSSVRKLLRQGYLYNSNWNFTKKGKPIYLGEKGKLTQTYPEPGKYIQQIGVAIKSNIIYFNPLEVINDGLLLSINNSGIKIIPQNTPITYTATEYPTAIKRKWFYSNNPDGPFNDSIHNSSDLTTITTDFSTTGLYYIVIRSTFSNGQTKESNPVMLLVANNDVTPNNIMYIDDINQEGLSLTSSGMPENDTKYKWVWDKNINGTFNYITNCQTNTYIPTFPNYGDYFIKCIATYSDIEISSNIIKVIVNNSTISPATDQTIILGDTCTLNQIGVKLNPCFWRYSIDPKGPFISEIYGVGNTQTLSTKNLPVGVNYVMATDGSKNTNIVKISVVNFKISPSETQYMSSLGTSIKFTATINPIPDEKEWFWGASRNSIYNSCGSDYTFIPKDIDNDSFFVACKVKYNSTQIVSNIVKVISNTILLKDGVKEKFVKINTTKDTIKALWSGNPKEIAWQIKNNDDNFIDVNSYTNKIGQLVPKQTNSGVYFYRARVIYISNNIYSDPVRVVVSDHAIKNPGNFALKSSEKSILSVVNNSPFLKANINYQWLIIKNGSLIPNILGANDSTFITSFTGFGDYKIFCKVSYTSNYTGASVNYKLFTDTVKYSVLVPKIQNTKSEFYKGNFLNNNIDGVSNNCLKDNPTVEWTLKNNTINTNYISYTPINKPFEGKVLSDIGSYMLFYNFTYKDKSFSSDTLSIQVNESGVTINNEDYYFDYNNGNPKKCSKEIKVEGFDNNSTIRWYYSNTIGGDTILMKDLTSTSISTLKVPSYGVYYVSAIGTKASLSNMPISSPFVKVYVLKDIITCQLDNQIIANKTGGYQVSVTNNGNCNLFADSVRWFNIYDNNKLIPNSNKGNLIGFNPNSLDFGEYKLGCYTYYNGNKIEATNNPVIVSVKEENTFYADQYISLPNEPNIKQVKEIGSDIKCNVKTRKFNYTSVIRNWRISETNGINPSNNSISTDTVFFPMSRYFSSSGKIYYIYCETIIISNNVSKIFNSNILKVIVPSVKFKSAFSSNFPYNFEIDIKPTYLIDDRKITWSESKNGGNFNEISSNNNNSSYFVNAQPNINIIYVKWNVSFKSDLITFSVNGRVGIISAVNEFLDKPSANSNYNIEIPPYNVYWDGEWTYFHYDKNFSFFYNINNEGPEPPTSVASYIGNIELKNGIQYWTVPVSGTYNIEAAGAKGGDCQYYSTRGGYGAKISANFFLEKGKILKILAGNSGCDGYKGNTFIGNLKKSGGGGGGGTFIEYDNNIILVAGGGGGAGITNGADAKDYEATTLNPDKTKPGIDAWGGYHIVSNSFAGGGGGIHGDGEDGNSSSLYGQGGRSYYNGGKGGCNYYNEQLRIYDGIINGGFGGGGAGCGEVNNEYGLGYGGGGGGYSGGAPGHDSGGGNGGSGYTNATYVIKDLHNNYMGIVRIKYKTN